MKSILINIIISKHSIYPGDRPLKGTTTPMIDFGTYQFKYLNTGEENLNVTLMNTDVKVVYT